MKGTLWHMRVSVEGRESRSHRPTCDLCVRHMLISHKGGSFHSDGEIN